MTDEPKLSDLEKLAIDNVIKRQQSLLELMRHTDIRSQQFIVAYAGFMGAALLFAAKEFTAFQGSPIATPARHLAATLVLVYAAALLLGAWFGFQACRPAKVGLASRGGDFWIWALGNRPHAIKEFIEEAEKHLRENEQIQGRAARMLKRSMICGAVAILTSGVGSIALVAWAAFGCCRFTF